MSNKKTDTKKTPPPKDGATKLFLNPMGLEMPTPPVFFATIQEDGSLLFNKGLCQKMSAEYIVAATTGQQTTQQNIMAHIIMCFVNNNTQVT